MGTAFRIWGASDISVHVAGRVASKQTLPSEGSPTLLQPLLSPLAPASGALPAQCNNAAVTMLQLLSRSTAAAIYLRDRRPLSVDLTVMT